ncbi:TcdA/TcdB pore-forming domain-containing protein [Pseudomonas sp. GL-B-19]|uniref:TcdA/TcdB pore-forming domain-containing protein n=1 Tax=Pseudomonas sp. GL-B-19 TaxID=2832393 RepID=UPI001CBDA795|nr:TcdA/TcdB pore-forming domain-containing protein [Pseudomonas sp. GL-B-19]
MHEQDKNRTGGYVSFIDLFKLSDLEQALHEHKGTDEYDAVFRYYFGCIGQLGFPQIRVPLGLLFQALGSFLDPSRRRRRSAEVKVLAEPGEGQSPTLTDILDRVEAFQTRLSNSVEQLTVAPTEVPKILHFVWLGGGVGDIQRDYINVWKQVLAGEGYNLKLWYDSDALLAYETNRIIVEAAKADAMINGGATSKTAIELGDKYEERAIVLKQQMSAHITSAVKRGEKADDARIDLLVRAYGQNEAHLKALKVKNRESLSALAEGALELRDLASNGTPLRLQAIYEREISLRGNFAAASDVVRVEALITEGGSYADVDNLPPLLEVLGELNISQFGTDARLGVLQLLLDHNPEWMPGRQALRSKYTSYVEVIPLEHRPALERFAKSRPALNSVFRPPVERLVRPAGLRAVAEQSSLSNAFLMAHPDSAMLSAVIDRFRINYDIVDATARLAMQRKVALIDAEAMSGIAQEVVEKRFGPLRELPEEEDLSLGFLIEAAATYYSDGIRPQSEVTIYLTGPAAMRDAIAAYVRMHFTPQAADAWREDVTIAPIATVNRATEEELDHSWKENTSDTSQWLASEQKRWQEGKFKNRFMGDMAQLLKYQSIDFEEGWPVIEGRHVLSTGLLQHLADELGEPFLQAMNEQRSDTVTFEKAVPLSFDDRKSINAQDPKALPPASLSDTLSQRLSVDEILTGFASGSFLTTQLSPAQRLLLGALLGAKALDNRSFEAVSAELDNLVNTLSDLGVSGRYAAIERQLFKHNAPAFVAGVDGPPGEPPAFSEHALELKKNALTHPLTLRQWGQHVARIQQVAKLEYRDRVVERVGIVLDSFHAGTTKLVPQDLLLQGAGERVGGRCYPLTLAMAAALVHGPAAANTLRERFYLGVIDHEENDSAVFLHAVEEMRGVQLNEMGTALARSDVAQVVAVLEAKTSTSTLMLNSNNHSMLVAKTFVGERSLYHFYDPNFGVFEFEQPLLFREALEQFFLQHEMAKQYAAYGEASQPTFDLIELDGTRLSATLLPSGIRVSELLQPGPLKEQSLPAVRQRLTSAYGESLMSNPRLGSSLLELDSYGWSQQIHEATTELLEKNQLPHELVPLFETLEVTPVGEYRLSLIDPKKPEQLVQVITNDQRFLRIKTYLSEQFSALATKPRSPVNEPDPTGAGSVHTLNAGFTIQALMNALRNQEGAGRPLTMAVRLHAYVNYAQLVHGNVVDVLGLVKLVRQALAEEKVIAQTCAPVVTEALGHVANEGVGTVLGLANAGFDIYQLSTADNDVERAQYGTQLAFDSASVLLAGAGIGAGVVGASTAAAVLGGAGVILGGLAIGAAALAQGFAVIAEEVKQVGLFFDGLERALRDGGYRFDEAASAWLPQSVLVFQTLDLKARTLAFGSPELFPLRDHLGVPDFDVDYARAIDVRRELGLPGRAAFAPVAGQTIVLPCTPKTIYGYEYKWLPFSTLRHDVGFDTARRLEKRKANGQRQFLFSFYSFPGDYIVYRLNPVYQPTVINVRLDAIARTLVVPALPKSWHDKITYKIEGAGANCSLVLNPGVRIELESPSQETSHWLLQASWAKESDVRVERFGGLFIGAIKVELSGRGRHEVLIKIGKNQVFKVDFTKMTLTVIEQDATPGMDAQALQDHFKTLARAHRLGMPYTPVHQFPVPFEKPDEPRFTTAWYDSAVDRFLYIRDDERGEADEALLGAVVDGYAYFYHPRNYFVWQVDAVTGLLKRRYRLLLTEVADSLITHCKETTHGVITIVQKVTRKDQTVDEFVYQLHENELYLSSMTRDLDPALEAIVSKNEALGDWAQVLGEHVVFAPTPVNGVVTTVDWQPAVYVSICWKVDSTLRDLAWIRRSDRLIVRPTALRHRERGWPDSIKNLQELTLVPPANNEGEVFVVYDKVAKRLSRQQRINGTWSIEQIEPAGLVNVVAVEEEYLALTDKGLFFNVTAEGRLQLGGLTDDWLKDRAHWWLALDTVASQYPVTNFAIVGLTHVHGHLRLSAWYVNNRLLLSDLGRGEEVRLLSVTPDNTAAWLLELSTGEIYRQAFIDPAQLASAFGQGSRLLQADAIPAPVREWAPWRFTDVTAEGAGLRATTLEGINVELRHQESALITGVDSQWVTVQTGPLQDGLKQLVENHRHAAFLSVDEPDSLQWYVTETGRLIRVSKASITDDFELLGTQQQTNVLLHENKDGLLHTYPGMEQAGPVRYVQRNAEVLTIEGQMTVSDLMPLIPDDVNTLILRLGQGAVTYRLSKAAWLRLESVIVDCRPIPRREVSIPGKLIWALDTSEKLVLSKVQDHLVIVDTDCGHSLILRDVFSADVTIRGEMFLAVEGYRSFAVSTLVNALLIKQGNKDNILLSELVPAQRIEIATAEEVFDNGDS